MAAVKTKKIERKADQIAEIKRCGTDPVYFIKKYVKISHPTRGPIPFQTYPYQEDCVSDFLNHRLIICNKSRQLGLSTVSAAYSLWMALFRREKNILVIATKLETAKLFLRKVKGMFDSLPEWLVMPTLTGDSVKELRFSNGSIIKAIPTSPDAGRGEAVSLLIVDEAAHIDDFDELWTGLQPMLSTGGNCILISSPKGVGNQFYNIWKRATDKVGPKGEKVEGSNDFWAIELPWTVHPEHDQAWFESQCRALLDNPRAIAQELLCSFEASGFSFLDKESMVYLSNTIESSIARFGPNMEMDIWKYAVHGHNYVIGADVARGDADDYSACHVVDVSSTPCEVVAEYKGRIQPDRFAEFLVDIAKKYNNAFIVHEKNAAGYATSLKLKDTKYPHVYYQDLFNKDLRQTFLDSQIGDMAPGFTTSVKTRPEILAKLEAGIRNQTIRCRSKRLLDEFTTFAIVGDKPKAQKNCNDDLVMALAIAAGFIEFGQKISESNDLAMAMLKGMSRQSKGLDSLQPPGSNQFGHTGRDLPIKQGWNNSHRSTPQQNVDMYQSLDWLLRDS